MRGEASVAAREREAVAGLPPHQSPSATASPSGEAFYLYKTGAGPAVVRLLLVYFSFTLLWYTTIEMPAVMTSVTQKAFQMPSAPSRRQNSQASGMMTTM